MNYTINGRRVSRRTFLDAAGFKVGAAVLALMLVVAALGVLLTAWILMLVLGGVHHSLWAAVPALGFWQSVLVAIVLNFLSSFLKR